MDQFVTRSRIKTGPRDSSASSASLVREDERDDKGPPAKKQRVDLIKSEDRKDTSSLRSSDDDDNESLNIDEHPKPEPSTDKDPVLYDDDSIHAQHQTAFESSLPAVLDDQQAIQEYELMRASQSSQSDNRKIEGETLERMNSRSWIPGRSSIYVDAFNLALDTVLEDELHLFNNKEKYVFEQWRSLTYEAQYLSVARKTISQAANRV